MLRRRFIVAAVAVWAIPGIALVSGSEALAGKPPSGGGGGSGGGRIWYSVPQAGVWFMNSDGSEKTQTAHTTGNAPEWSWRTYGGREWLLRLSSPEAGQWNLVASRDDGFTVQLTSGADFRLASRPWGGGATVNWVPGRDAVSWVSCRFVNGTIVEGGLYVADLAFAPDGQIAGLEAQPASATLPLPVVTHEGFDGLPSPWPLMARFSWAPDGTQFAWSSIETPSGPPQVHVGDISGADRVLVSSGYAPAWSPDGSRILYQQDKNLCSITPAGAGALVLVRQGRNSQLTIHDVAWSPTGSHVAYGLAHLGFGVFDVYRIAAPGGTATKLSSGALVGWTH